MVLPVLCGCSPCCDIGSDTFDRADNDSLGASWSERSGDADIVSNQLKFITAGLVRFETAHPDGTSGKQTVYADIKLDSTSSYARLVCSYVDDNNYIYASVEQVSSCWVLRLAKVDAGVTSTLDDDVPMGGLSVSNTYTFRACWDPVSTTFSAVFNDQYKNWSATGHTAGDKVGLAGSANVIFDNFDFDKLEDESNPTCPDCAVTCLIGEDQFDGTSGTDLGCRWEEVSGSWEINGSGQLYKTSTGAGICRFKVPHPERGSAQYVEVDCILPNSAPNATQRHRVLLNYVDASNHHYAELWINTSNTQLTLTIGTAGGTSTTVARTAAGGTYRLVVCYDDDNDLLTASVQTTDWTLSANISVTTLAGEYVCLGAGSGSTSGGELFDNFEYWKHKADNDDDRECPDCLEFSTADPTCCCDNATDSYTLDLGAGGWVDGTCAGCDTVAGEYHLQFGGASTHLPVAPCAWYYLEENICGTPSSNLWLELINSDSGVSGYCLWTAHAILGEGGVTDSSATWASINIAEVACGTSTSLDKTTSITGTLCTGDLPDTITATRIP